MALTQAPKSPGKTSTTKTSSTAAAQVFESSKDKDRREGVEGVFQLASVFALMRGQFADAGAFSKFGGKIAHETMLLGKKNEQIGKTLDLLSQAGPYAGIVMATVPLLAQLAVNHGRIPADKASGIQGVVSPAAMEADVKKELAQMELAALQAQKEAEQAIADLKAEQERSSPNGVHAPTVAAV